MFIEDKAIDNFYVLCAHCISYGLNWYLYIIMYFEG